MTPAYLNRGCFDPSVSREDSSESLRRQASPSQAKLCPLPDLNRSLQTQQTAKNLFLWQGRSFVRKALEIPLALWLNLVLPKRRVMEIYD